jgi:dipeptidyl aminopeptidase/acylaminoacyl peptidase
MNRRSEVSEYEWFLTKELDYSLRRCAVRKNPVMVATIILLMCVPLWGAESGKRPITPEDVVSVRQVDEPVISPDGRFVAFVVYEPADTGGSSGLRNADIWVVSSDGSNPARKFAFGPKQETMPRWSPDGSALAFLSDRADGKNQVYTIPTNGGEATALTTMKEGVNLFKWCQDSRNITLVSMDTLTSEEELHNKTKQDYRVLGANIRHSRLYRVDVLTQKMSSLKMAEETVVDFDYSPDGSKIAVQVAPSPSVDDYYRLKLVIANSDGSEEHDLADKSGGNCRWSEDGSQILQATYPGKSEVIIPELVSIAGVRVPLVGEDYYGAIWEMKWVPSQPKLLVSSQEGVQGIIGTLDIKSRKVTPLRAVGRPYSGLSSCSIDRAGKWVAFLDASPTTPTDVWIMKIDGSGARQLTNCNPQVDSLSFGATEKLQWRSDDSELMEGVLVKPTNYQQGKAYPLVTLVHGGPAWAWWHGCQLDWYNWAQLLANNGFAVLLPNPRGSACCGWKFAEQNRSDWGDNDFKDVMSGIDQLVRQGIADSSQLAIGGWSYGGYMTEWAITQTHRFKAAVAGAGLSDLTSYYGTTDIPSFMRWSFVEDPHAIERHYDQHSAITFAKNVTTPTLILHGEADVRVPTSQSYEFYQALKDLGVPTTFVVYPREPHSIGERAHQIDIMARALNWYKSHLVSGT